MWVIMCVCHHVCHMQARSCLSTGWALNRCFAWFFGTVAVLAQGGGGVGGGGYPPLDPPPPPDQSIGLDGTICFGYLRYRFEPPLYILIATVYIR